MSTATTIEMYADLYCPYAYLAAYRLRKLREEYAGRVEVAHRSLALEYVNRETTPKRVLDMELPILMLEEPDIPWQPWAAPDSAWPVTMWPAFEAVKCAERQSLALADELDWRIRVAFFGESRCVSMRHVLIELAGEAGLDVERFTVDFDSGVAKQQVVAEARAGWETVKVDGSPTFVLPDGTQISNPGLPEVDLDEEHGFRPRAIRPAPCAGDACLDVYRRMLDQSIASAGRATH
ncbi:MAG: DsbA family protein [Thermomicrobiales bacterium]